MGQSEVIIPGSRYVPVFDQGEVQVSVEAFLQLRHILQLNNPSDADLFALLLVSERGRHVEGEPVTVCGR